MASISQPSTATGKTWDEQRDQMLLEQWKMAVGDCCRALERDDLRQVSVLSSSSDMEQQIEQVAYGELALATALGKLRDFTDASLARSIPGLETSTFWGLTRLLIKLVQDEPAALSRVSKMSRTSCQKLEAFNKCCSDSRLLGLPQKEVCMEIGLALLNLISCLIKFIRSDVDHVKNDTQADNLWQPVVEQFSIVNRTITESLSRMQEVAPTPVDRPHTSSSLSLASALITHPRETAEPPFVILPRSTVPRFFDRVDTLQQIEAHFSKAEDSFRSLAIYGLGGVGKSTVAIKYAESLLQNKAVDALFWVYSEKLVSIRQSFTDIALQLRLPGSRAGDHEENRALVLSWLQNTKYRWLIIYDNAEHKETILPYWPAATHGQALITTRNHSLGFDLAENLQELSTWDTRTGSKYLIHLLSTDIGADISANDEVSAMQLSKKLSGHALALSHMAALIHRRAWSIEELVKLYDQHGMAINGTSGNKSIQAIWELSFSALAPESAALLGVLCFLAPDNIPQALFEPTNKSQLPVTLGFCSDTLRFSESIEELLTLALIKRNKDSRMFSIHRLVQDSFMHFMTSDKKRQCFHDASVLLSLAFPRTDSDTAQLYLMWPRCAQYLPHVLNLKDCFREAVKINPSISATAAYCDLSNACQRYLLEINAYSELEDVIDANFQAIKTLPAADQTIALQGSLTSHLGQLHCRLGNVSDGIRWLRRSYELRDHDVPFNPRESSWAADNAGCGYASNNEYEQAIRWFERARDHWLQYSNATVPSQGVWPAHIKTVFGMTLVWANQPQRGRKLLDAALEQIKSAAPYQWAGIAYVNFALGNLSRSIQDYERAEDYFIEAQNAWVKGDELRTAPFNASCMYKLGCVALDLGKSEAAIKHLRDAMVVTNMLSTKLISEHARVMFKLSEALEQEPGEAQEAKALREEAGRLIRQRVPDTTECGLEQTYDRAVYILWR